MRLQASCILQGVQDERKTTDSERELRFQRRIAELGFMRGQMPWDAPETPFTLPFEQTKYASELELETDENRTYEETERRVLMDLISQTYNFRTFYKRLHYELKRAQRYQRPLSLLLLGIDRLEGIASQYGAPLKEAVIRETARAFMSSIRDVDLPGRCREDSFGIILPETPFDGAEVAAERLRIRLENCEISHEWQKVKITVSVGGATFPTSALVLDELFAVAAEALVTAGRRGGNLVLFSGSVI